MALAGALTLGVLGGVAAAAPPSGDEAGVTMRVYQLGQGIDKLCTLKSGQTPNVDQLKQSIDWDEASDFGGLEDNFVVEALANLSVPTTGTYTFRLTSDDGSRLKVNNQVVVDHDGLHGATAKEGTIALTAGTVVPLRIDFFEATNGQQLTLAWKKPGDAGFTLVPNTVLSTEAGVTRVTAPGFKQCEGQDDSAGDGLQLAGVNPAYDLTNLRPSGFEPKVTGLEWMGDDLLVLTWGGNNNDQGNVALGEVWRLSGVKDATGPADVTRTLIANGLKEPQGIKVVDGDIYVSEKQQLTKLTQPNASGVFQGRQVIATLPTDTNFHEFAFGMLYRDGKFHLNLSVSINLGGATTVPQGSYDRGTHVTIEKDTGKIEFVAGGLRTPHGMGEGPNGEIFVTDNQGGWLPANKLVEIKPGRFFNHFTTEPDGSRGRFDDQPVTKPIMWMPQNEIANSPSTPMWVEEGPYKDQLLIGDVTYGGLQRGYLDKVEGEYQGALFRMTQGLEAGVSRVLRDPENGDLYIGGIGNGGNWGQNGKLRYGLQKLSLNGAVPFDMKSMEVIEGGFKITYTEPVSPATLQDLASKYQVEQWRYRPTAQYGGPKIDEESLEVTSATPSADGLSVELQIAGLKEDRVVHLRSPRPFDNVDGETLWSTEAWYTLNNYPGYVAPDPEPALNGLYELEDGELFGTAGIDTEHAGYSGTGFVDGIQSVGAGTAVDVITSKAGNYDLKLGYANGPNPFAGPKKLSMYVGGVKQQITLPSTTDWKTWGSITFPKVALPAGTTTVRLVMEEGDDGNVNLDYLQVTDPTAGRVEAEDGTVSGTGNRVQTEHAGYSGTGYVGGFENDNTAVTFDVTAAAAGTHNVKIGYANGPNPNPNQTKQMSVYVNDVFAKKIAFPPMATWKDWGTLSEQLELAEGLNVVSIRRVAGDNGNVNIDYLDLGAREACAPGQVPGADDEFDGTSLDTCRWSTILNPTASGVAVANGQLRINAQSGDLSGGAVDAKNMILQPAPADGTWEASTQLTMTGKDDYLQGGLVAWTNASNYAKLVAMQRPEGNWVLELGRRVNGDMVYKNADLPGGTAPANLQLKLVSTGTEVRGLWSTDQGATWQSMGSGYPSAGLVDPKIGVAAYNGTGSQLGLFDWFKVGNDPVVAPDTCEPVEADPGYRMLYDGTAASLEDWHHAGPGFFTREADCELMTHGGLGLLWHTDPLEGDYSLQLDWRLDRDDNGGVFVGFPNPETSPRNPGDQPNPAGDPWVAVDNGYEIQIDATDDPDSTTGAVYNFQSANLTARDAALNPVGQWNHYEIRVEGKRIRIYLNDQLVNDFTSPASETRRLTWPSYIGLQNHGGNENVRYRDVQVKELADPENVTPTVTVTPTPAEVTVGESAEVEITVDSAAQETPTGEVTLSVDGTDLAPVQLENGTATVPVGPFTEAGTVEMTASYDGDIAHDTATGSGSLTVVEEEPEPVASTVAVSASPAKIQVGQTSKVTVAVDSDATEAPTGELVVSVNGKALAPAQLTNGTATVTVGPFKGAGTVRLAARYAGDAAHQASSGTGTIQVVAAPKPSVSTVGKRVDANPKRTKATISVRCATADCKGTAVLRLPGGKTLGQASFSMKKGQTKTLTITLNNTARQQLKSKASVKSVLVFRLPGGATKQVQVNLTR
ncbi:hypothetical protein GCM10023340_41170 [Nocardioides marinquilinus]|uniref:DUF1080 domain-containing protein n=1 Tax=Nocardioides marinquilinus TaxID=1210400 RepID=A0ABP9Q252_9ACTN